MATAETKGSDNCIIINSIASRSEGITGYRILNAGRLSIFSTSELTTYIINPDKGTITFCCQKGRGRKRMPAYYTFLRSKIRIETVSRDKEPAVIEAENLLKQG